MGILLGGFLALLLLSFLFGYMVGRAGGGEKEVSLPNEAVEVAPVMPSGLPDNEVNEDGTARTPEMPLDAMLAAGEVPAVTPRSELEPVPPKPAAAVIDRVESARQTQSAPKPAAQQAAPSSSVSKASVKGGGYAIVVSSKPVSEENPDYAQKRAEADVEAYKKKGFTDARYVEVSIPEKGRYYRVIAQELASRQEALSRLESYKKQNLIQEGWVWNRE